MKHLNKINQSIGEKWPRTHLLGRHILSTYTGPTYANLACFRVHTKRWNATKRSKTTLTETTQMTRNGPETIHNSARFFLVI